MPVHRKPKTYAVHVGGGGGGGDGGGSGGGGGIIAPVVFKTSINNGGDV